jgi:hypothetical protein
VAHEKADTLASLAILRCVLGLGVLLLVRTIVTSPEIPAIISSLFNDAFASGEGEREKPRTVTRRSTPVPRVEPLRPEVRRATSAVKNERPKASVFPTAVVVARRASWSNRVLVPVGKIASVTFSLGRIRIERNGKDIGTWFRRPSVHTEVYDRRSARVAIDPFAMLDKTPRTVVFDKDTRVLRFRSSENSSGEVVVQFKDAL